MADSEECGLHTDAWCRRVGQAGEVGEASDRFAQSVRAVVPGVVGEVVVDRIAQWAVQGPSLPGEVGVGGGDVVLVVHSDVEDDVVDDGDGSSQFAVGSCGHPCGPFSG